jgi:hypothetical protein
MFASTILDKLSRFPIAEFYSSANKGRRICSTFATSTAPQIATHYSNHSGVNPLSVASLRIKRAISLATSALIKLSVI